MNFSTNFSDPVSVLFWIPSPLNLDQQQFSQSLTVWKVSKYGVFSGPYSVLIRENKDQKKLHI